MKRLIFILAMFSGVVCYAAPPVMEQPIMGTDGPETLSVSTSAWTAGWASAYSGMSGMYVTSKATNTANIYLTFGTSAPTASIGFGPIVLKAGVTQFHNISEAVTAYFVSTATAAEYVDFLRVKQ
jgi:hypothetical protein